MDSVEATAEGTGPRHLMYDVGPFTSGEAVIGVNNPVTPGEVEREMVQNV